MMLASIKATTATMTPDQIERLKGNVRTRLYGRHGLIRSPSAGANAIRAGPEITCIKSRFTGRFPHARCIMITPRRRGHHRQVRGDVPNNCRLVASAPNARCRAG